MKEKLEALEIKYENAFKVFKKLETTLKTGELRVSVEHTPMNIAEARQLISEKHEQHYYEEAIMLAYNYLRDYGDAVANWFEKLGHSLVEVDKYHDHVVKMLETVAPIVEEHENYKAREGRTAFEHVEYLSGVIDKQVQSEEKMMRMLTLVQGQGVPTEQQSRQSLQEQLEQDIEQTVEQAPSDKEEEMYQKCKDVWTGKMDGGKKSEPFRVASGVLNGHYSRFPDESKELKKKVYDRVKEDSKKWEEEYASEN